MPISPRLEDELAASFTAAMVDLDRVPEHLEHGHWHIAEAVIGRSILELQRIAGALRANARP